MALPIVAVVGRPNVGKSTFVNRITQQTDAIVHEARGVTRDRSYHQADWNGVYFMLIDTGGIEAGGIDEFQTSIRTQALMAAEEADAIVFLVDGKTGLTPDDEEVARILKRAGKPTFLAVNKMDTPNRDDEIHEFWGLGLGQPWPVSATHGHGTGDLLDEIVKALPESEPLLDDDAIDVAIIGRPNAGKSSLLNKMAGVERAIVSDVAGTTRDAIDMLVDARRRDVPARRHGRHPSQGAHRRGRRVLRLRARDARDRPRAGRAARHRLDHRPDRPGPARRELRRRARLRDDHPAQQVGRARDPGGEGRHRDARRRAARLRRLRAGAAHPRADRARASSASGRRSTRSSRTTPRRSRRAA